jgi:hypothetical protein
MNALPINLLRDIWSGEPGIQRSRRGAAGKSDREPSRIFDRVPHQPHKVLGRPLTQILGIAANYNLPFRHGF